MKLRRALSALLVCVVLANYIITQASAAEVQNDPIRLEDMTCEQIDLSNLEPWEECTELRSVGSINGTISAHSISAVSPSVFLPARSTVTFNCSYSPSSASMDFGVLTPDGRFYFINVKGGSIQRSIRISQSGSYAVAIRNNSSQTVRVVGFVEY